jgi:hypothetical protein
MLLSRLSLCAAVLLAAPLAGCRVCPSGPWGNETSAPEVELVARTIDGSAELIESDGALVDLTFPVQGGHVLFLGARVKNLLACRAELFARLEEPGTGDVAAEEKRQVAFTVAAGGGHGMSDVSDTAELANVPACPNFLDRDVVGATWKLELKVTDEAGRSASVARDIVPACRQDDPFARALCRCECKAGYSFGRCSDPLDGGW